VTRTRSDMLRRRLTPLYAAAFLQNLVLWVPIAKLFMTTIGFNAASVGAMAAVYAVVVPNDLSMLEFGPLWLVALLVPAFLYGPHWAGLTAALGLGALPGAQAVSHLALIVAWPRASARSRG
jgi:hypothetical protein